MFLEDEIKVKCVVNSFFGAVYAWHHRAATDGYVHGQLSYNQIINSLVDTFSDNC